MLDKPNKPSKQHYFLIRTKVKVVTVANIIEERGNGIRIKCYKYLSQIMFYCFFIKTYFIVIMETDLPITEKKILLCP